MEGVANVGSAILYELGAAIDYATGLGIGLADLPAEAIEWHRLAQEAATSVDAGSFEIIH